MQASCFVLEISRFFETCKLGDSDVIYSQIINYIYQMVNISVNNRLGPIVRRPFSLNGG